MVFHRFPLSGPAYDLSFWELRDTSVLVQWKAPVYTGNSPVTGYFLEMAKKGSSDFSIVNAEAVSHCYLRVISFALSVYIMCS